MYYDYDDEWESLQKEEHDRIVWEIENRISDEDLKEGPILYDCFTGVPIYRHGGCYDPR